MRPRLRNSATASNAILKFASAPFEAFGRTTAETATESQSDRPARGSAGVPNVAEQGFPSLAMREWFGFFMPGGTAPASVEAASRAIREAARQPALQAALADAGMVAVASTPDAMRQRIADELPHWQRVLATTGVRAE